MSQAATTIRPFLLSSVAAVIGCVVISHVLIDAYSNSIPAILGLLEVRCGLTEIQSAWLSGFGALASGLTQPLFAWLSDRWNTRVLGGLGLALATLCFCNLQFAHTAGSLFGIYGLGMLGVAMYHPIVASTIGQILPRHRSTMISVFFVSGMVGSAGGAMAGPMIASRESAFQALSWVTLPGIAIACALHYFIGGVSQRSSARHLATLSPSTITPAQRWTALPILYVASVLRFSVNLALFYLFLRWLSLTELAQHPEWTREQISRQVAPTLGKLICAAQVGMALGGVGAGVFVTRHRERGALIWIPIAFAPIIAILPSVGSPWTYVLSLLAGVGFASMIPTSLSVAQRLLPEHPSVASGFMLGGAWAVSMASPRIVQFVLEGWGISAAFWGTAGLLAVAGVLIFAAPARAFECD